jgi:hypothetical protein
MLDARFGCRQVPPLLGRLSSSEASGARVSQSVLFLAPLNKAAQLYGRS